MNVLVYNAFSRAEKDTTLIFRFDESEHTMVGEEYLHRSNGFSEHIHNNKSLSVLE